MILVAADFKNSGTKIAWDLLKEGKSALDALEQGIRAVEANTDDPSVGKGGFPNASGIVQVDAGVMDGRTRHSGAVGAIEGYLHPVSIAYAVMRKLPHVLLVGEGANRFAAEIGAEEADLMTEDMTQKWQEWKKQMDVTGEPAEDLIAAVLGGRDPQKSGGTTVYLAQDSNGDIVAATSTSGWAWKYPGRIGDTPIAGAGFYADNRYGAAACTGMGELAIRTGLARMAVGWMQTGMNVADAVREALEDITALPEPNRGITLYAIDNAGNHHVGSIPRDEKFPTYYYTATDGDSEPRQEHSEVLN